MAITSDGTQAFGLNTTTIDGFVVESFSTSFTSNRVDLDDSNGEPLGSTTIPGRVEFSASFALHGTWPWSVRAADVSYDYASSDGWLHVYVDKLRLSPTVKRSLVADLAARVRAGGNVFAPFAGTSVEVRW